LEDNLSDYVLNDENGPPAPEAGGVAADRTKQSVGWEEGGDKARILATIFRGQAASRKELVRLLRMRSTSVSEMVGDLLRLQLLAETTDRRTGRGRPSLVLVGNPHRIAVMVFTVASQAMHATCLNLLGQVLVHEACELNHDATNTVVENSIALLATKLKAGLGSGTELVGASFSLPGLVDAASTTWVFSSRWPLMRRLNLASVLQDANLPVSVCRNLDAELHARLARDERLSNRTLLFHWGYGIGAAFASEGKVIQSGVGGFGEVGHWRWSRDGLECRCGRRGCLETTAALWSLGPELLGDKFDHAASEESFAALFSEQDLLKSASVQTALSNVVMTLANLCRVVFPETVVVSGPFVKNTQLWIAFREAFAKEGVLLDLPNPELISDGRSRQLEMLGAAGPLLSVGLDQLINGASGTGGVGEAEL
jgi:predicted NBD/HSP70 family sugar kinase